MKIENNIYLRKKSWYIISNFALNNLFAFYPLYQLMMKKILGNESCDITSGTWTKLYVHEPKGQL